jgi:hypothetical protein
VREKEKRIGRGLEGFGLKCTQGEELFMLMLLVVDFSYGSYRIALAFS